MAQPHGQFGYQIVRITKTSSLGVGSYGAVYRALCDELPCAAKVIHPTLFETHDPGAQKIMERFEQECQFLSGVRHPNIVQYLGVSRDPNSGLPVLLTELMDSSLTRFLERSEAPLSFHIQVDICHDIALALTYLHSNGIIHRNLSSNNVLLIGPGYRAKVTDFGMSMLADANPRMTPMMMCPGTLVYMPPEALDDPPVYTNKLDCFSFGVLDIQILTCQFPTPTRHCKIMEIDDPRFPNGQVKVPVPEVQRRQSHIVLVNPAHPLLPVALDCLKNRERERPSAQELCHHLGALKDNPQYGESVQRATTDGENVQIRELRAEAQERQRQLDEKDRIIARKERQLQKKDRTVTTRNRQLRQLNQQLEANEQVTADFQHKHMESEKTIEDLRETLAAKNQQIRELQLQICNQSTAKLQYRGQSTRKGPLRLHWSRGGSAPCEMIRPSSVVDGNIAYFHDYMSNDVYSYDSEKQMWSSLPQCPYNNFRLAVVNGLPTTIGGSDETWDVTNQLLSLTGQGKWVEHFPHMPTKRYGAAAVCSGKSLVVAGGGNKKSSSLNTVEVMDTETLQWSTASSLPFALRYASATICQDHIYMLGDDRSKQQPRSVLACFMADLLQSCQSQSLGAETLTQQAVWYRVANLPVRNSSCTTLCGQLLAVGGRGDNFKHYSTAIHQYNTATNSWEVISHMHSARSFSLVAVLPDNTLMVVGGIKDGGKTDKVEIATLQE